MNVGNGTNKIRWYPADRLQIVPWQPIKGKINSLYTKDMLEIAETKPRESKRGIKGRSFAPLGIAPVPPGETQGVTRPLSLLQPPN